jgi:lipoprotein-releasing system permease protein
MYRLALCYRYVMSRFLTLVATVAVLLGVAVLVVVMAVMGGFTREVRSALRGGMSDVIIASDVSGFPYYEEFIAEIKKHPNVTEATPVVQLFGLLKIKPQRFDVITRPCMVQGVRPEELDRVCNFKQNLEQQRQIADVAPSFEVTQGVFDQAQELVFGQTRPEGLVAPVFPGCIPGRDLVSHQFRDDDETRAEAMADQPKTDSSGVARPDVLLLSGLGARLQLTTLPISARGSLSREGSGVPIVARSYTVVDHYVSRVYEFDRQYIFIPFDEAQKLGELGDLSGKDPTDLPRAHQIFVALKDYEQAQQTVEDLKVLWRVFAADKTYGPEQTPLWRKPMSINTWEQEKATILSAYQMQYVVITILLGLVVLVAGFLIGAILTMIVREKTRDIGIMKCLGASNFGVAWIFLLYAVTVSSVGAILGLLLGKLFIANIDAIEVFISKQLGIEVFDRKIYLFDHIPRYEDPWLQTAVVAGAILCAVACSLIAAWRAARLQPVEALRYE